ncbi:siderophore-interacting protein [Nonomuraea dietziae]|uniref:siderophore-interacting protein n=1 Tax=Nonomuraea dietziae TaxID=65515 RepID=UPI00340894DA
MIEPFRVFDVHVSDVSRVSDSFLRVTFTGDDLDLFADNGFDQRIKLILPLPGYGVSGMPRGADWFTRWRALPDRERNPLRTYTVRAVRPELREVDVDIVLHGDGGPAARWANSARPGDRIALFGPDAGYGERHGGLEFRPPADARRFLMAGDETAVPAITAILERLPDGCQGEALMEVPSQGDVLPCATRSGVTVTWLPRGGGGVGSRLVPEVKAAADRLLPPQPPAEALEDVDVDVDLLWEVPEEAASVAPLYAWLAGEAAVIRTLRRHLVAERGMDRRAVAFMGYWRMGRAED